MRIPRRAGRITFGAAAMMFALSSVIGLKLATRQLGNPPEIDSRARLHLRLDDTVFFSTAEASTVEDAISHLEKPAVIFAFRESCHSCLTGFSYVEAVARSNGMQVWMLVVTDSAESWLPAQAVLGKLDLRPARVSRVTATGWGRHGAYLQRHGRT